jgi:hypothetical protein
MITVSFMWPQAVSLIFIDVSEELLPLFKGRLVSRVVKAVNDRVGRGGAMISTGVSRHVLWVIFTDVSEEHTASILIISE